MPVKKYHVELTVEEYASLARMLRRGSHSARKLTRALILLKAAAGMSDEEIAQELDPWVPTIERTRKRFAAGRLEALQAVPRPGRKRRLDERGGSPADCRSVQPGARGSETLDLTIAGGPSGRVATGGVLLGRYGTAVAEKNTLKPWLKQQGCIPEVSGAFVAAMEDVLALYAEEYDEKRPKVNFDETSRQLIADLHPPLAVAAGRPQREDHEYERNGTRNLFIVCEPQARWQHVTVTERRTTNRTLRSK